MVSAMTLPTLVKNHQRQVYTTQLHQFVSMFSQAVELYVNDSHAINLKETRLYNNADGLRAFINSYFKVAKDCGTLYTPCFAPEYKTISGGSHSVTGGQCNMVVTLSSGASICVDSAPMEDTKDEDGNSTNVSQSNPALSGNAFDLEVDLNGTQGPNVYGRDYFFIKINHNGEMVEFKRDCDPDAVIDTTGLFCYFGKVVNDGWKMDY